MKNKTTVSAIALILLATLGYAFQRFSYTSPTQPTPKTQTVPVEKPVEKPKIGERTKYENCVAQNGLSDKDCTPGNIIQTATKIDY